jgi:hypothetical protein
MWRRKDGQHCIVSFFIALFTSLLTNTNRYKAFKDALALGSKGNSLAGATAQQIAANKTSLTVARHKKCAAFEIFNEVFGESPNCKPVHPMEVGGFDDDPDSFNSLDDHVDAADGAAAACANAPPAPPAPPSPRKVPAPKRVAAGGGAAAASAAAPATAAGGNVPATFHLAPSKKEKKMDLGEAYLKAQQSRIASVAACTASKNRCDMIVAFVAQGKTSAEISLLLTLAGLLPMYDVVLQPRPNPDA